MDIQEATYRYMAAHVRLHSQANINGWSLQEVMDSFFLLPKPQISLQEFGAMLEPPKPPEGIPIGGDNLSKLMAMAEENGPKGGKKD